MKLILNRDLSKKLELLKDKEKAPKLAELAKELDLGMHEVVELLKEEIGAEENEYSLSLTPREWMDLYKILSAKSSVEVVAQESLRRRVLGNGPIKVVMELLSQLEQWDQEANEVVETMVMELEAIIKDARAIHLETVSGQSLYVLPLRVIHLEGELTLVGEDQKDHALMVQSLKSISHFTHHEGEARKETSLFEIEEFVAAIRKMNEKETRLILKIHDPSAVNLYPDHHFLGKPCMVNNPNGDLIWAAYVEPCEALFDWLTTLGTRVEILDPSSFKEKFLEYCREKMRKIA